jgi:hypothetical protein
LSRDGFAPNLTTMLRRLSLLLVLVVGFVGPVARAADAEFLRVWPGWRDAEAFDRIGEYFGSREPGVGEVVLRTQPEQRAGYYFLARVKNAAPLATAKFELSVIRPDHPEPKLFTFPANVPAKETVFQLGLTGADWPAGKEANPVAWKIALVDGSGRVLAEHKSFLWEKPAK